MQKHERSGHSHVLLDGWQLFAFDVHYGAVKIVHTDLQEIDLSLNLIDAIRQPLFYTIKFLVETLFHLVETKVDRIESAAVGLDVLQ